MHDIMEAINDLEEFTKNITYEQFIQDKKTLNAAVRSIEIIGEGSMRLWRKGKIHMQKTTIID